MTNASHTPGPWDFDNYADHVSYFSDANKHKDKGDYDFRVEFPDDMPEDQAEANARLIAAAPQLLEALEHFFNIMHDYESSRRKGYVKLALDQARAAIGKAKGGAA